MSSFSPPSRSSQAPLPPNSLPERVPFQSHSPPPRYPSLRWWGNRTLVVWSLLCGKLVTFPGLSSWLPPAPCWGQRSRQQKRWASSREQHSTCPPGQPLAAGCCKAGPPTWPADWFSWVKWGKCWLLSTAALKQICLVCASLLPPSLHSRWGPETWVANQCSPCPYSQLNYGHARTCTQPQDGLIMPYCLSHIVSKIPFCYL